MTSEERQRIVVGVDGSAASKMALSWAATQARLTGAELEAVIAWDYPTFFLPAPQTYAGDPTTIDPQLTAHAAKYLSDAIAEVGMEEGDPRVVKRVAQGHPAQVLLDAADDAQLLAVGSHGHGPFTAALLGSVALHCVQHARCPVVVLRAADE